MLVACKRCKDNYGDRPDLSTKVVVLYTPFEKSGLYTGWCKECGGMTEPCLTPEEATKRIEFGWYSAEYEKIE